MTMYTSNTRMERAGTAELRLKSSLDYIVRFGFKILCMYVCKHIQIHSKKENLHSCLFFTVPG